jgi:hypothetical protein
MLALQVPIDITPFGSPHERPAYTREYEATEFLRQDAPTPYVHQPREQEDRQFTVIAFEKVLTIPSRHDHYRPKTKFPALANTYTNLFYCCNACNSRKGNYWPKDRDLPSRFVANPCDHVMFSHLRFNRATVEGKSEAGKLMLELLDLNDEQTLEARDVIIHSVEVLIMQKHDLEALHGKIRSRLASGVMSESEALSALAKIDEDLVKTQTSLDWFTGNN